MQNVISGKPPDRSSGNPSTLLLDFLPHRKLFWDEKVSISIISISSSPYSPEHSCFLLGLKSSVSDQKISKVLLSNLAGPLHVLLLELQGQDLLLQAALELEEPLHCQLALQIVSEEVSVEASVDSFDGASGTMVPAMIMKTFAFWVVVYRDRTTFGKQQGKGQKQKKMTNKRARGDLCAQETGRTDRRRSRIQPRNRIQTILVFTELPVPTASSTVRSHKVGDKTKF